MAILVTDNRTVISEADATTGWTSTSTLTANTVEPTPVEATSRLDLTVSNATQNSYFTLPAAVNLTGSIVYFWFSHRAEFDTTQNIGVGIQLGDGTNRAAFGIMGSDAVAFSHFDGPVTWQCLALDVANRQRYPSVNITGTSQSLNVGGITQIGLYMKTIVKAVGGAVNCFIDIGRYTSSSIANGTALTITSGSSSDPGSFQQIALADRRTGSLQAHGVVRQLGSGLFGVQGGLTFGNATGTDSSWFEDKNVSVSFENRKFTTDKYKLIIVDNGVGTTTFKLGTKVGTGVSALGADGCSFVAGSGVGCLFDSQSDIDVTDVFIYGSTFTGFTEGIFLNSNQEFINNTVSQGGTLFPGTGSGAILVNSSFSNLLTSRASASVYWNTQSDTSGKLDGCNFTMGVTGSHAIELGPNTPSTIDFNSITFTSYEGTPGTNLVSNSGNTGSAVYNNSGKAITINISQGTVPAVRNGAGATTTIVNAIQVTLTGLKDNTEVRVLEFGANPPVELAGTENATDGTIDNRTFSFSLTAGTIVTIVVHSLAYEYISISPYTVPSAPSELPIQQRTDRNYINS
jgi:hypothetical protein